MTDVMTKEQRSHNMSMIHGSDTKPEEIVRKYLFNNGFRYRKNDAGLPGKPDIVLPKYKTIIFVNGCFWHKHENCKYFVWPKNNSGFWKEKINGTVERDKRNIAMLEKMGWKVIVIWECQLKKNIQSVTLCKLEQSIRESYEVQNGQND